MIYEAIKDLLLTLLRAPTGPPEPPAGSPGSVQVFRASPKYLLYRLILTELFFVGAIPLSGAFALFTTIVEASGLGSPMLLAWLLPLLFALLAVLAYFAVRLEYDMRYYIVTDRSLRIREGIFTITEVTLTYANVQRLEVQQGPMQQVLGIADVIVRTAGGGGQAQPEHLAQQKGHRGVLRGIENAEQIRDQINFLLKRYRDAGLGDPEDRRRAAPPVPTQWSALAVQRLHEIRDELRLWHEGPDARITV